MNRRKLLVEMLLEWLAAGKQLEHIVDKTFTKKNDLKEEDKAWIYSIIFGIVEKLFTLKFVLKLVTKNKFKKNKSSIKAVMFLAAYELLYTKSKAHAIVNEAVSLVGTKYAFERKLVNGVLRELERQKGNLLEQIDASESVEVRFNIPQLLHDLLLKEYSEAELLPWYEKLQTERGIWVRRNSLKNTAKEAFFKVGSFAEVKKLVLSGEASIQNRAAGAVVEFLAPKAQTKILDFCSAPGTKTAYIAELTGDQAEITATDSDEFRLSKVDENIKRLGLTSIKTAPMAAVLASDEKYDQVLVDIPCSGIGTLGKRSDLVHHFSLAKLDELEKLQLGILDKAKSFVKAGGELVLSTCTILKRENADLAKRFLDENSDFSQDADALYCLPFTAETDGSFAIKLKRKA